MNESISAKKPFSLPGWLDTPFHVLITGAMPLVLILLNARILMTNIYLNLEYSRPNFPVDTYGFTTDDRLTHAPLALDYLFNNEGTSFLGDQTFPDGSPLYNDRELSHMDDVKVVTRKLSVFGYSLIALWVISIILMIISRESRPTLLRALLMGALMTIILLIAGLIAVATSFDWLFTAFHQLFFEGNSWIFLYSDTLIRLFPIRFWIDAFALMFGGALLESMIIGGVAWRLLRKNPENLPA